MPYTKKLWQDRIRDAQGNIIQEGTPVSAGNMNNIENGIAAAHAQLDQAARAKQTLIHGVNVLNGSQNAPVNIEIEGRTLIPQQNNVLDASKYYVLADKKTRLKWADATISAAGIHKFTGRAERPTIIRIANFEGKISGSTLENPHICKYVSSTVTNVTTVLNPNGAWTGETVGGYTTITKLDGSFFQNGNPNIGVIMQQLFGFDVIQEIERQIGRIPGSTLAQKVQWAKDNIEKVTANWHGYGSGPAGNKATFGLWRVGTSTYANATNHANGTITKLSLDITNAMLADRIDANGFIHLNAYADASDGVTSSFVSTDYIELEIELKPTAMLHLPRLPLYEVTKEHYDAVNVTWSEAETLTRYPAVEGVTHLQNPYLMASGANMLPGIEEWGFNGAVTGGGYDVTISDTYKSYYVDIIEGQKYSYNVETVGAGGLAYFYFCDANKVRIGGQKSIPVTELVAPAGARYAEVILHANNNKNVAMKNWTFTIGTPKLFVPYNPSYALFETKLAKMGDVADRLFEQDGKFFKRENIKEVVLDGALGWTLQGVHSGMKRFGIPQPNGFVNSIISGGRLIFKYNGALLKDVGGSGDVINYFDSYGIDAGGARILFGVSNNETGFTDIYSPTANEVKAYFNGWKAKTVDANGKPTAWMSLFDGTDAPTQTEAYVATNKAPNFTPYKVAYIATPQTIEIKSEGAISVNGLTQVEVGSGVVIREKVVPVTSASTSDYHINNVGISPTLDNPLKNKTALILGVYKNNVKDNWTTLSTTTTSFGRQRAYKAKADYDSTAEYFVTYFLLDRQPFTTNPVNVTAQYANNIRSALEDAVKKVEDNTTAISVSSLILYDVLKRLKAGGL